MEKPPAVVCALYNPVSAASDGYAGSLSMDAMKIRSRAVALWSVPTGVHACRGNWWARSRKGLDP